MKYGKKKGRKKLLSLTNHIHEIVANQYAVIFPILVRRLLASLAWHPAARPTPSALMDAASSCRHSPRHPPLASPFAPKLFTPATSYNLAHVFFARYLVLCRNRDMAASITGSTLTTSPSPAYAGAMRKSIQAPLAMVTASTL